jgi:hypothetical protein
VRTPDGWRYAFGQASLPLPPGPPAGTLAAPSPSASPGGTHVPRR